MSAAGRKTMFTINVTLAEGRETIHVLRDYSPFESDASH